MFKIETKEVYKGRLLDLRISDVNIQRLFSPTIYSRGLKYYKCGLVSGLSFDLNSRVWTAMVHGTEDYFVEIDTPDTFGDAVTSYCDCPAFDTFGTCKHVAAVLIGIVEKERSNPAVSHAYEYSVTTQFIQAVSSIHNQDSALEILPEKQPLHIEYNCKWSFNQNVLIELKAGVKRPYVVKDAKQFLADVVHDREHFFTQKFSYSPETHYILKQDMEIVEKLYAIYRNEQIYDNYDYYHYRGRTNDKRFITIPPLMAKELLEKLAERNFTVDTGSDVVQQPQVKVDTLPFNFSLSKNNRNDLLLTVSGMDDLYYFKPYLMLFHQGVFYFPNQEQIPVIEAIIRFSSNSSQLPIPKNQADTFISEVLPSLKKVSDVAISEKVAAEIIQVPLRAKLYLEEKDEMITGKLEYHYGNEQINPFSKQKENESDVMIIRDVEKEQQIMRLIEHANFHYNGKELYIDTTEAELYDFLYTFLPKLNQYVELFLTSDIRQMIVEKEPVPSTNVRMDSATNLLEIGFDIEGVDDEEVSRILKAVIEKKRYYRLESGALLSLEGSAFASVGQFFHELNVKKDDINEGNVYMPIYRGMQIDALMDTKKKYDPAFRKLLHHLQSPEEQVYALPEGLTAELRNYQHTGYQWFKSLSEYHLGGILADDMGLGKTLQSIAYIVSERSDKPHLIVAPSSVVYNWKNEIEKFAPALSTAIMTGIPADRHARINEAADVDVWITSYATLRQDIEIYQDLMFQTMILDEAQYIKNYNTKTSRAIRQIAASRKFALSGTPIENSIDELWAIFQVVLPGLMPNQKTFRQLEHEKISSITKPFILRRLKKDVLTELPEKIESVYVSELAKEQKELYVGYLRELQQETAQSLKTGGFQQNRMKILAGLTRLRQICCHPSLFLENYSGESGKLAQLMETIQHAKENGKRLLVFSQFTSMHKIIGKELEHLGIDYFYLHGQTSSKDRVDMSERFNNGERDVFLISLKAGGTGLNLTGADTVILYDLWWNPAVEDQATGRAHRFGQKNVVQVIRLVAEGTIEEKIYELQQKKRELIDKVIQPGETMLSSLSEADVRELLSI